MQSYRMLGDPQAVSHSASLNAPLTASAFSTSSFPSSFPQSGSRLDPDVETGDVGEGTTTSDDHTCNSEVAECSICLEKLTFSPPGLEEVADIPSDVTTTAPCGHAFHKKCLSKWLSVSNQCPVCRSDVEDETVNDKRRPREQGRTAGRRARSSNIETEGEAGTTSAYSSSVACFVTVLHTFLFLQQASSFVCSLWFAVCGEPLLCAWCLFSASGTLRLVALGAFALLFCGMSALTHARDPPMIRSQQGWEAEVSAITISVNLSLLMTSTVAERMLQSVTAERDSSLESDVRERRRRAGRRVLLLRWRRMHRGGRTAGGGEAPQDREQTEETDAGRRSEREEGRRRTEEEERSDSSLLAAAAA